MTPLDTSSGEYRFEILPGVSHWIPDERPDKLADLLARLVRRSPKPTDQLHGPILGHADSKHVVYRFGGTLRR